MAADNLDWDAAFAAQQHREATDARRRADALRDDAEYRKQSALQHRAATDEHLRRGIHRDMPAERS